MNLDLPDHAQVLIFVGDRQTLPQIGATLGVPAAQEQTPAPRSGRPKLKMLGVAALAVLAFIFGQHQGLHHAWLDVASSAGASTGAGQACAALPPSGPGRPLAAAPAASPGGPDQVPTTFAQQLQQPPAVTPPPGAPPAGAPSGPHAFGLEQ